MDFQQQKKKMLEAVLLKTINKSEILSREKMVFEQQRTRHRVKRSAKESTGKTN
jgi:hypothetical protein